LDNRTLIFTDRNIFILLLIHPASAFFDFAGTIPACLPDAAVLLTAGNGVTVIPALSIMVWGNVPEAVPAVVCSNKTGKTFAFQSVKSRKAAKSYNKRRVPAIFPGDSFFYTDVFTLSLYCKIKI
jgi:hypothetical protein